MGKVIIAPPTYENSALYPAVVEKGGNSSQQQQESQPIRQESSEPLQRPQSYDGICSFHIYKVGGMFNNDDIITTENKGLILFYLQNPRKFLGRWDMTLRFGSKTGPPLLKINVKGWSKNIIITSVPNDNLGVQPWESLMIRRGTWFRRKCYEFQSIDGTITYNWFGGAGSRELVCTTPSLNNQEIIVATVRRPFWALSKQGQLIISPGFAKDTILLVSSATALEELVRNEEEANRTVLL